MSNLSLVPALSEPILSGAHGTCAETGTEFAVISDLTEFLALEDDWNALFTRAGSSAQLFQTFNWNRHWCDHFLTDDQLRRFLDPQGQLGPIGLWAILDEEGGGEPTANPLAVPGSSAILASGAPGLSPPCHRSAPSTTIADCGLTAVVHASSPNLVGKTRSPPSSRTADPSEHSKS